MTAPEQDPGAPDRRVLLRIHGKVQGVWYRAWTRETGNSLGLDGWVRNRRDGTVEALVIGAPDQVAAMIEACREGPPLAQVTEIEQRELKESQVKRGPGGFHMRQTF